LTPKEILLSGIDLKPTPRLPVIIPSSGVWIYERNGLTLQDTFELAPDKLADVIINNNKEVKSDVIWLAADCSNVVLRAIGAKCTFNVLGGPATVDESLILKSADVDHLRIADLENSPEIENLLKTTKIVADRVGNDYLIGISQWGPFTLAGQLMGIDNLLSKALRDKSGVKHVLEFTTQLLKKYWGLFVDAGAELVCQSEPVSSGDMISKKIFAELAFPYIKSANDDINGRVKAKMLHICGKTTEILDLIPQTGADLFSLDYKVDLALAREKLGGKIAFGGQLDPIKVLLEGSPKDVETASKKCINDAGLNGYVLMPGCDVPPKTKMENVQAMIKVAHQTQCNKKENNNMYEK